MAKISFFLSPAAWGACAALGERCSPKMTLKDGEAQPQTSGKPVQPKCPGGGYKTRWIYKQDQTPSSSLPRVTDGIWVEAESIG